MAGASRSKSSAGGAPALFLDRDDTIVRGDETLTLGDSEKAGPVITDLFEKVQGIQYGELPDTHGWCVPIEV